MAIFKSKEIPEELPDLPLEEFTEEFKKEVSSYLEEETKKEEIPENKEEASPSDDTESENFEEKNISLNLKTETEETFFNNMLKNLETEIKDLSNLEEWFNETFSKKDMITNMKDYWQGQKKDLFLRALVQKFKEKISENIKKLQKMEMEWQEIYFKLAEKEEEMKKQEEILKKAISEFISVGKKISSQNVQKNKQQKIQKKK